MPMSRELKEEIEVIAHGLNADGCTASPDFSWHVCCDEHDIAYKTGCDRLGIPISKWDADQNLYWCMRDNAKTWIGRNILSWIYWIAVSTAGWYAWFRKKQKFPKKESEDSK